MSDLTHLFNVGQKVFFKNTDFDAIKKMIPCEVKEVYKDNMVITDTETDTDLYIEQGFNLDYVFSENNMIRG